VSAAGIDGFAANGRPGAGERENRDGSAGSDPDCLGRGAGETPSAAQHVAVTGVVQSVGFRPFVYGLAGRLGVRGWVRNTSAGVEIHAEGDAATLDAFARAVREEAPPRAYVATLTRAAAPCEQHDGFVILESVPDPDAYQLVSPDIATCEDCRREVLDPADRRHEYPFTNCTNCGPRFTIIEGLPYDRERTTMRRFPLCPACRREYEDPSDRRFHAEPNACPVCGPSVRLVRRSASGVVELAAGDEADPAAPVRAAAELLRAGEILAVKGLGGFHLACDATDDAVVRRLKERKRRPDKPLAVMFRDLDELRMHCRASDEEVALLTSPERPIVLLEWREIAADGKAGPEVGAAGRGTRSEATAGADEDAAGAARPRPVSVEVAVVQRYLGAMLPYTPLHLLLLRAAGRPLVMTSGNLAEEPIVKGWEEADRLAHIADAYLLHDREIAARYDDSVALVRRGAPRLVRRSRGYAPFPVPLPRALPQVLACGAELKNTFCATRDAYAFLSQHIGDLENLETLEHYETSIAAYERMFRLEPEVVAYDLHPEYLATKHALGLPQEEKVGVQHHHAHLAARLVEHGREGPAIGVCMDGLGYGDDGVLWGGEVLVGDLLGYERVAHLEELPLPGGALAVERPARTAAGWVYATLGEDGLARAARLLRGRAAGREPGAPFLSDEELAAVVRQVQTGENAPLTTSCGRLFDAVAALAGVRGSITYEGQAAIELEMMSRPGGASYPFVIEGVGGAVRTTAPSPEERAPASAAVVRLAPLLAAVMDDLEAGGEPGFVGSRLHATLSALTLELCRRVRAANGLAVTALTGGVFQNRLLGDLCERALEEDGFEVLGGGVVPTNDGGVALGQAAVAGYTVLRRRGLLD
jgi:hydrogenase maturation protein HypF